MKFLEFAAVQALPPPFCRFFKARLLASLLCLAGFWICVGQAWQPLHGPPPRTASPGREGGLSPALPAEDSALLLLPPPELAASLPPMPTVVVDAGHGGADGGTPAGGMLEKEWTLKVALRLAEELKERGHAVTLLRSSDETIPLPDRLVTVNSAPRSAVISIHFNAGASDAKGIETLHSWPKRPEVMARLTEAAGLSPGSDVPDEGAQLAAAIQNAVHDRTGARDRGVKNRQDLALTSRCLCPAVIVECGFLSNADEGRMIKDESYRVKLVRGIADGYEHWLLNRDSTPIPALMTPPASPAEATAPEGKSEIPAAEAEH